MKILYTSADVHKAIKTIFTSSAKRRVAVVAYLGETAEKYLPNPEGIEIICCPEPGATSPRAVSKLLKRGANIKFSEGLHSKVYWSSKGCIITSANISYRALGNSPQKEAGILINSNDFDIDRLIKESKPFEITQSIMNKLEINDRKLKKSFGFKSITKEKTLFLEWYSLPYRSRWKIGWWDDSELDTAKNAKNKSINDYDVSEPEGALNVAKNQVTANEWLLCFKISEKRISEIEWMYVDFVVAVSETDNTAYEEEFPFQAIQVHKATQYPLPPFKIEKNFRNAFEKAVKEYGVNKIEKAKSLSPPAKLLTMVETQLKYNNV